MQTTSQDFIDASLSDQASPVQSLFVAWDRQTSTAGYFTIGVSLIGSNAAIRGDGNNPAEADKYLFYDESAPILSLEYDRLLSEPVYSTSRAIADIVLDNTDDRYTPGFDPTIGAYIIPQRPLRISMGFNLDGSNEMVQTFVGQIAEFPETDQENKTVTLHAIDYAQVLWDFPIAQTQLYQNKRTDELIVILLSQFGLSASKYSVDIGSVTIPYAFFSVGDKMGDIFEKLCEAEQASFYVDELGVFRFENRTRWLDAPHTNRKNLKYQVTAYTSGAAYWKSDAIPVTGSTLYYFRSRYISTVTSKVTVELTDNVGGVTTQDIATSLPIAASWAVASGSFTTGSTTVSVKIYHQIQVVGTLQTDDYYLTTTQNATLNNLVANFSVELGSGTPSNWTATTTGTLTATSTWYDRGISDIVVDLTDDHVFQEQQLQPHLGDNSLVNLVEVFASPRAPMASNQIIFSIGTNDARFIPAGATVEFFADYADPLISNITPTAGGASSNYLGNSQADGLGTNLTSNLSITSFTNYAQSTKVDIHNSGADAYLTSFNISGKTAPVTQRIYVKVSDSTSISKYQEQPLQITNDFIQTYDIARAIAQRIVGDRKDPASYLTLTCKGLPQLQLGDTVGRNGIQYWIIRIKGRLNGDEGLVQDLTLVKRTITP